MWHNLTPLIRGFWLDMSQIIAFLLFLVKIFDKFLRGGLDMGGCDYFTYSIFDFKEYFNENKI